MDLSRTAHKLDDKSQRRQSVYNAQFHLFCFELMFGRDAQCAARHHQRPRTSKRNNDILFDTDRHLPASVQLVFGISPEPASWWHMDKQNSNRHHTINLLGLSHYSCRLVQNFLRIDKEIAVGDAVN